MPKGNEFIAYGAREGQVSHGTAVKMAQFQIANAKFASTEAILSSGDTRPVQQFSFNDLFDFNSSFHDWVLFPRFRGSDFIPLLLGDAYFRGGLGRLLAHELAEDSEVIPSVSGVDGRLKKLIESIGHSRIDPTVSV